MRLLKNTIKDKNKNTRIVIIGGIAAGTSAAVKARRYSEDSEIIIYEKDNFISYGTCGLPYYIAEKISKLDSLIINTVEGFEKRYNIKVNVMHEVLNIDPIKKQLKIRNLKTCSEFYENFDKLIISTGSIPLKLNIRGIDSANVFTLKTIDDAVKLKNYINTITDKADFTDSHGSQNTHTPTSAILIGGGFIGLELLEAIMAKEIRVKIIEKTGQLLPMFDYQIVKYLENYLLDKNVKIIKEDEIVELITTESNDNSKETKNTINSVKTVKGKHMDTDFVFIGIGTKPDIELAKNSGIKIGSSGAISVNEFMQTNFKDIYSAGDCCECKEEITGELKSYNLASIANRQGRIAGYNAAGGKNKFNLDFVTILIKVLDLTIAKTGISYKELRALNQNAAKLELHYLSHSGYYPGASLIHMLIVYDKVKGTIFGFEAIGKNMVDKKADIFSLAIKNKMKIWDLASVDLGYHPEFGAAKDSINIIGMIGENIKKQEVEFIDVDELEEKIKNKEKIKIIDVRSKKEYERGHIEGAILIPIDDFRQNLDDLYKDDEIIVHCASSYRSYLAYRILKNLGFNNVKNLNGSYMSWVRKI
ncbi:MAG: FAD-dependent oxidoreductase [Actinomycetota bacterium]|nr:FAD-dependent oxidoreductase [Actinomycetota bacterium]